MEGNSGYEYWHSDLSRAALVVAPMVDQSELPWRLLCRRHGAQLCFTPMLHATLFSNDPTYRKENFQTCPEDRPLIAQFCANNPDTFTKAAKLIAPFVDGIDLNLGCPQQIARRGNYGAFLQDEWDLIHRIVSQASTEGLNISCKIRVFDDVQKTVRYAKMIEAAGAKLISVHGRTRDQKRETTGLASWSQIKAVKEAVGIPVFANGNIQYRKDVDRCLEETGVEGVMTAEGNLHNPALFENQLFANWELALEYLDLVEQYPCQLSAVRGHVFKLMHHSLEHFPDIRDLVAHAPSIDDFRIAVNRLKTLFSEQHIAYLEDTDTINPGDLPFPHWICQPYVRKYPSTEEAIVTEAAKATKRAIDDLSQMEENAGISRKRLKRMLRNPRKYSKEWFAKPRRVYQNCKCQNPMSEKCDHSMCKKCCRSQNTERGVSCIGHRLKGSEKSCL